MDGGGVVIWIAGVGGQFWMCATEEGGCATYVSRWSEVAGVVEGDGRVTVDVENHVLGAHPSFIFGQFTGFKRPRIVFTTGI